MSHSAKEFAKLLYRSKPSPKKKLPLLNLTFLLGAGFSKSWDSRFPVGNELFSFTYDEWKAHDGPLEEFLSQNNYQPVDLDIDSSMFKDLVYQIGMMKKYSEIRPRYIDNQNLETVERHLRYLVLKKFEKIAPLYYEESQKITLPSDLNTSQRKILELFKIIERSGDGSQGLPQGIRANYLTTNYDFVIEAILDNVIGPDDTYELYTYRGISPIKYCDRPPIVNVFDNWLVSNLLKINGGFEIFKADDKFEFDYRRPNSDETLRKNPPQLMLASREQDYTQSYFRAIFPKIVRLLHETQVLVIVGYSLPEEDALLRLLIRQFAEDRSDGSNKVVFYIDISKETDQIEKINAIFPHIRDLNGLTMIPHSGSFSEWCKDVLKLLKSK